MEQKFRLFCVTDFECDAEFVKKFYETENVIWLKYGIEKTKEEKKHFQMIIYFKSPHTIKSIIKKLKPRHVEISKGNIEQNDLYVSKDGDVTEYGVKPTQGRRKDLKELMTDLKNGTELEKIADENPAQWLQYRKGFAEYKLMKEPKRKWKTNIIIFSGNMNKCENEAVRLKATRVDKEEKFMMNYDGEDLVYFHRFDPRKWDEGLFYDIVGNNPYKIRVPYGSRNWKPRTVIFITNFEKDAWPYSREWMDQITINRML